MNALFGSVWARTALLYTLIFFSSSALLIFLIVYVGQNAIDAQIRTQVRAEIEFLRYEYAEEGLEELLEETEERIEKSPYNRRLSYVIQSPSGAKVFDDVLVDPAQLGWQYRHALDAQDAQRPMLFYFHRFDNGYILGVGSHLTALDDYKAAALKGAALTLLITLAISLVFGIAFGRYFSRRLNNIIAALQAVAAGRLNTRLPKQSGGSEFEHLSSELNHMFQKVEDLLNNLKHISRGLAHDLRTPLAILKNRCTDLIEHPEASPAIVATAQQVEQDINHLLQHFESLLLISELESGELNQRLTVVNFSALLAGMHDSYAPLFEEAGIACEQHAEPGIHMLGDTSLLQRMLSNLFDNILQNAAGVTQAQACVQLRRRPSNPSSPSASILAELIVSNTQGVPETRMAPPAASRRHGMGLKITQAIVKIHGGNLSIDTDSQAFLCRLTFPLSPSSSP